MRSFVQSKLPFPLAGSLIAALAATLVVNIPLAETPAGMQVAYFISWPGYNGFLIATALFLVLPFTVLFPSVAGPVSRRFWAVADLLICSCLLSQAAKYFLRWPRPSGGPSGAVSGHTLCAFCLAWLWSTFHPRSAPYAFACAVAVGWSRVYIADHFPYQVFLGAILGTVISYIGTHQEDGLLLRRILKLRLPVARPLASRTGESPV
jgi:membrane-associated phospholipid phosphatase